MVAEYIYKLIESKATKAHTHTHTRARIRKFAAHLEQTKIV